MENKVLRADEIRSALSWFTATGKAKAGNTWKQLGHAAVRKRNTKTKHKATDDMLMALDAYESLRLEGFRDVGEWESCFHTMIWNFCDTPGRNDMSFLKRLMTGSRLCVRCIDTAL